MRLFVVVAAGAVLTASVAVAAPVDLRRNLDDDPSAEHVVVRAAPGFGEEIVLRDSCGGRSRSFVLQGRADGASAQVVDADGRPANPEIFTSAVFGAHAGRTTARLFRYAHACRRPKRVFDYDSLRAHSPSGLELRLADVEIGQYSARFAGRELKQKEYFTPAGSSGPVPPVRIRWTFLHYSRAGDRYVAYRTFSRAAR